MLIQIITKNNDNTITKTVESIRKFCGPTPKIVAIDLGSGPEFHEQLANLKVEKFDEQLRNSYSELRNKHTGPGTNFYIEPYEHIVSGDLDIKEPGAYAVNVLRDDIITREVRIWHGPFKFVNPIHESLAVKNAKVLDVLIQSKVIAIPDEERLLGEWQKANPTSYELFYYKAFFMLKQKKYHEFLSIGQNYLFRAEKDRAYIMMHYYMATVWLYIFGQAEQAVQHLLHCIAAHPGMAEFWCLLGDVFYGSKDYLKAREFYQNASIVGQHRKMDLYPVELSKYDAYPQKMYNSCQHFLIDLAKKLHT